MANDLDELLKTWNDCQTRSTWLEARDHGADPNVVDQVLAEMPEVHPLDALKANRQMVDLLTGRRWFVMRDAREAGASWAEIGAALGMTKQGAQDWYRRKIEAQAEHVGDRHDGGRAERAL